MADQVTWTAADGSVVIDLTDTDSGYTVLGEGTQGLRSVSYALTTQKYAGIDGEAVQAIQAASNTPSLGLLLAADDEDTFRDRARALRRSMRPKTGLGTLAVRNSVGEVRSLFCYCTSGLEGDESLSAGLPGSWWKLLLKFYAPDPWWYGQPATVNVGLSSTGASFFPITPVKLGSDSTVGGFTVDLSDADAESYPRWTVTGPGTSLSLTNQATGQNITVNATLAAGQSLVIDTRPGAQSVRRDDGTNLMGYLAAGTDPALWALVPDTQQVTAALVGATATSRITATYRPRYAGI